MTDNFPDIAPEAAPDASPGDAPGETPDETGGSAAVPGQEGGRSDPAAGGNPPGGFPDGDIPIDSVEGGVALHIMQPDDPGTIMVAVAEPADMLDENVPPCAQEVSGKDAGVGDENVVVATAADFLPRYGDLTDIVAVRLGGLGPALFFFTKGLPCASGDNVIVEMEEGHAAGKVASVVRAVPAHLEGVNGEGQVIRSLVRKATDKDIAAAENNRELAKESLEYCSGCIKERNLDMKLVDVLTLHDRSKMVFYFTAPARIDFRELVKDLVRRYRTRIELRQIGVRHETQMVGALGNCGMVCCCRRYLRKFAPVAIKMAKEQNVFLNPVKISGICGRLLCCLAYEQEHYDEFYRSCPKLGKKYHTDAGIVRVLRASLFRESVTVLSETGEELEYPLVEWNGLNPSRPNAQQQQQQQQPPRKQEQQGGDGRRKAGGRGASGQNGSQQAPHEQRGKEHPGRESRNDFPASADADFPQPTLTVTEEQTFVMGEPGGITARQSRSVTDVLAEDTVDEVFDGEGGSEEDVSDGSIFGLSPRHDTSSPGSAPQGNDDARRKRPHRRRRPRPAS